MYTGDRSPPAFLQSFFSLLTPPTTTSGTMAIPPCERKQKGKHKDEGDPGRERRREGPDQESLKEHWEVKKSSNLPHDPPSFSSLPLRETRGQHLAVLALVLRRCRWVADTAWRDRVHSPSTQIQSGISTPYLRLGQHSGRSLWCEACAESRNAEDWKENQSKGKRDVTSTH